jgi:hypothetical protein
VVGGKANATAKKTSDTNAAIAQTEENGFMLLDNAAANKAIQETNLQNTIRTGYRTGIINVQRGQARRAAAQQGINLNKQVLSATSAAAANSAGAGSIGNSVDAVVSDIELQAKEAETEMVDANRTAQNNYDQETYDTITAGMDSLQSAATVSTRRVAEVRSISSSEIWGAAIIDGAAAYASSYMSLGLGKKKGKG